MRTLSVNRRERVLMLVLLISVAIAAFNMFSTSELAPTAAASKTAVKSRFGNLDSDPRTVLESRQELRMHRAEIAQMLVAQKGLWTVQQRSMYPYASSAIIVTTLSKELTGIAANFEVSGSVASVNIDSSALLRKARVRLSIQGNPTAVFCFLDSLDQHSRKLWTRRLELTRTDSRPGGVTLWSGLIEVEALIRPLGS